MLPLSLLAPAHCALRTPFTQPNQSEDLDFRQSPTFADCFPASEKCYTTIAHSGRDLHVPFRRVHLTTGGSFDLYDTSGPQVRVEQGGGGPTGV